MEVNNSLKPETKDVALGDTSKVKVSAYLASPTVRKMLERTLNDPKLCKRFIADLTSAASSNPELQECEKGSVVSSALMAISLNLSISPSLGLAYLVPFNDKKIGQKRATFIPSYRAYLQLAMRSGYYKAINAIEVREGEYLGLDPQTADPRFEFISNDTERLSKPVIGYMAYFEYVTGFRKVIYWSKEHMIEHADTYSAAFSKNATTGKYPKVSFADYEAGKVAEKDKGLYSSFWYKNFDQMAIKTMLRQLISKWGMMSVDMENAFAADNEYKEEAPKTDGATAAEDFFEKTTTTAVPPEDYDVKEEQ